jgi:hypothetical protein
MFEIKKRTLRRAKLGDRRKKILVTRFVFIVLSIIVLISAFAWTAHIDHINITGVRIMGNTVISTETIQELVLQELGGAHAFIVPKSNFLVYPRTTIYNKLLNMSHHVRNAELYVDNFDTLVISIKEREPFALWCVVAPTSTERFIGGCHYLDDNGYIFARSPEFSGDIFFKYFGNVSGNPVGKQYMETSEFRGLNLLFQAFQELNFEPVSFARLPDDDHEIGLATGGKIIFNKRQDLKTLLDNLESILVSDAFYEKGLESLDYIDLRFGSKVYYKLK